jgi:hypothetical protein
MPLLLPPFDPDLVRTIATLLRPRAVVPDDCLRDVNPEAFARLAGYWNVAPTLWLRLRDCPQAPALVREQLREAFWQNVRANAERRAAASQLISTLNAQGVVPMLLKGACQLFDPPAGHAGTRFMVDLDVLVPPGQDRISFDILCALGFVPEEGWDTDAHHHWPKLTRPDDGLVLEVHKTPWAGGGTAEAEAFFAASLPIANVAGNGRLPCAGHRLLHNAIHAFDWTESSPFGQAAIQHACDIDAAIGLTDLRQLLDFAELCSFRGSDLDWNWILAEANRFGHKADLQQWGAMARELFGVELPDEAATWNVDRPGRRFRARCYRAAKAVLHTMGLLGPVRRLKSQWFK